MRHLFQNSAYFVKEIGTIISVNKASSILSLLSLMMIFSILLLALTGGTIMNAWIDLIKEESEISVYYDESISEFQIGLIQEQIKDIDGVESVVLVGEAQAYSKMEAILGTEAKVLGYFEENPFSAYFEVSIDFDKREGIQEQLESIDQVDYVRDNQNVLDQLQQIGRFVNWISTIVGTAVIISTFIITSHIIREGIHSNREHIRTLVYLGAPGWFVNLPYLLEGVLLTGLASIGSIGLNWIIVNQTQKFITGGISFIPAIDINGVILGLSVLMLAGALLLGLLAGVFGLKMVSEK